MYLIGCYVPESHLEKVKTALFEKGGGQLGNYDCCAWQTRGTGQFRPLAHSTPFSGEKGKIHREDEYKLELICKNDIVGDIIETLIRVHPYETPAYHVIKMETVDIPTSTES
jgi:hypothetical protein